jgi:hypothetical protein
MHEYVEYQFISICRLNPEKGFELFFQGKSSRWYWLEGNTSQEITRSLGSSATPTVSHLDLSDHLITTIQSRSLIFWTTQVTFVVRRAEYGESVYDVITTGGRRLGSVALGPATLARDHSTVI